jgi:hypothetical protein
VHYYLFILKDQIAELETRAHIVPYEFDSEKQDKSLKLKDQCNSRDDPQSDIHGKQQCIQFSKINEKINF